MEWAIANQPTRWDIAAWQPPMVTAADLIEPPTIQVRMSDDLLWFRMRAVYSPIVITRPDTMLKVTGV